MYEYDGVNIASSAVFISYFDALATAVVHDPDGTGATADAWSQERIVSLIVRNNPPHEESRWGMLVHA